MQQSLDFLHTLAQRVVAQATRPLYEQSFVFPSHRSGTFFKHYISQNLQQPTFAPHVTSIEDLILHLSGLQQGGRTYLLCTLMEELHQLRQELNPEYMSESNNVAVDHFERILKDFNDIDLFLAPANKIFRNMQQLEDLTSIDYLSPQQRAIIVQFWGTLPTDTKQKSSSMGEEFCSILSEMELLYTRFRQRLLNEGVAYQGLMTRHVAEMDNATFEAHLSSFLQGKIKQITIAGLYQITPAERIVLQRLKLYPSLLSVHFVWEELPMPHTSSPLSSEEWMNIIGNALEENKKSLGGEVLSPSQQKIVPEIEIIRTSSDTGRSRVIPSLIEEIEQKDPKAIEELRCAIVLPQEKGLVPLLDAIKHLKKSTNITMGYPLSNSSTAIWVQRIIDLHLNLRTQGAKVLLPTKHLKGLLRHPMTQLLLQENETLFLEELIGNSFYYVDYSQIKAWCVEHQAKKLSDLLLPPNKATDLLIVLKDLLRHLGQKLYATLPSEEDATLLRFGQLEIEFVRSYQEVVVQLLDILNLSREYISLSIVVRLLRQLIEGERTPFDGKPLLGLQVMGFLESRLINFDYLIIPDANEGMLPKGKSSTSSGYIPNALRIGYGLPTYRFSDYIESYYFYRLVNRARRVYFITGSSQDYEPSRYIGQIRYLLRYPVSERSVQLTLSDSQTPPIRIPKSDAIMQQLLLYLEESQPQIQALSASSIYDFVQCPLRFYFKHLCSIGEPDKEEDFLNAGKFGSIVHNTMQQLYRPFEGKTLPRQELDYYLDPKGGLHRVEEIIKKEYASVVLNKKKPTKHDIEGLHEVYCRMIRKYVCAILQHDQTYDNITYLASEQSFLFSLPLSHERKVRIKGFIDRVDKVDGHIRIIDYKTGSDKASFPSMASLFFPTEKEKPSKAIPQLLLYAYYWCTCKDNSLPIVPTLYSLKEISKDPTKPIGFLELKELPKGETEIKDFRIKDIAQPFSEELTRSLEQLFDPEQEFCQTSITDFCSYCPYKDICGR